MLGLVVSLIGVVVAAIVGEVTGVVWAMLAAGCCLYAQTKESKCEDSLDTLTRLRHSYGELTMEKNSYQDKYEAKLRENLKLAKKNEELEEQLLEYTKKNVNRDSNDSD